MANATASHRQWQTTGPAGPVPGAFHGTPAQPATVVRHHANQDLSVIPGGQGWKQSIPTTSNLSRSQLTEGTNLSFELVRLPLLHDGAILPLCIDLINYNDDGDVVTVKETDRTHGLPHMNTAHNMMLTDGVLKQHTRTFHFEQYATDVAEMPTPHHYSKMVNLDNKFFVDKIEQIWADAKSRMLRTLELMVRRAMKVEFPTQFNLTKSDESACRRMVFGTYAVMNRFPRDWVTSVFGTVVEGLSNQGFRLADGVAGNIILAPRQACVEEFGNARETIKPLTAHENEDPYSIYPVFQFENGQIVGTATRTGSTFQVGRFTVAPYDQINTEGDDLPDSFFERRQIPSSVVIDRDTIYAEIPTPEGRTKHTSVDLAISAGLYYETCCLDESEFTDINFTKNGTTDDNKAYFFNEHLHDSSEYKLCPPPFPPTVGGTWALQTDEGAAALCGWLERVASQYKDIKELSDAIKRRTGFTSISPQTYLTGSHKTWFEETHKYLAKRLTRDEISQKICILALLPGSRKILSFLHELSPFTICNFTLQISPWANCADLYMMHPKPMTAVSSDNTVGMFNDPTKFGVKRWRINSRLVVFRHSTEPDLRITDAFISGVNCMMSKLSTACQINRKSRLEDENRCYDAFAIFSGIDSSFPAWCRFGQDSVTKLPCSEDIKEMFGDTSQAAKSAKHMISMMQKGNWVESPGLVIMDCSRECPVEGWVPWEAKLYKKDAQEPTKLEGMKQGSWR